MDWGDSDKVITPASAGAPSWGADDKTLDQAAADWRAQHAPDVPLPPSLALPSAPSNPQSLDNKITNLSAAFGGGITSGLADTAKIVPLVAGGVLGAAADNWGAKDKAITTPFDDSIAGALRNASDKSFAAVSALGKQAAQNNAEASDISRPAAVAGNVASILPMLLGGEGLLPERLASLGDSSLLQKVGSNAVRALPVASALATTQAANTATNAVDQGAGAGTAENLYGVSLGANTLANLIPGGAGGNLLTRALTGGAAGLAGGYGSQAAEHAAAPQYVAAPDLQSTLTSGGIGALLGAVLGIRPNTPEAVVDAGDRLVPDEQQALLPPTPPAGNLPPGADYTARAEPLRPTNAPQPPMAVGPDGTVYTPAQGAQTLADAILGHPRTARGLPEPVVQVDANGVARLSPQQVPLPSAPVDDLLSRMGLTPDVIAAQANHPGIARDVVPPGPLGLPAPVTSVDSAGNATDSAAYMRALQEAQAKQDAALAQAKEKADIGLTPDVERAQAARWAAQTAADPDAVEAYQSIGVKAAELPEADSIDSLVHSALDAGADPQDIAQAASTGSTDERSDRLMALSVDAMVGKALDAGVTPEAIQAATSIGTTAQRAHQLSALTQASETSHGTDTQAIQRYRGAGDSQTLPASAANDGSPGEAAEGIGGADSQRGRAYLERPAGQQAATEPAVRVPESQGLTPAQHAPVDVRTENLPGTNIAESRSHVRQRARELFAGRTYSTEDGDSVNVPWQGIKHSTAKADPRALAATLHLDELLEHSRKTVSEPDTDERRNIKAVHQYESPMTIDGRPAAARIYVREHLDGSRYYDHAVIEKNEPSGIPGEGSHEEIQSRQPAEGSGGIIAQGNSPREQAFKKWFGDSKVADKSGNPLTVYHGTGSEFHVFDHGQSDWDTGHASAPLGHFFTADKALAERYAENASEGRPADERVVDAHLSIQHPAEWTTDDLQSIDSPDDARAERARLEAQGHDGIHIADTNQWIAFRPEQIKSASENRGTFDPSNPDIRFSRSDEDASDATGVGGSRVGSPVDPDLVIKRVARDWRNAPPIHSVARPEDLPKPILDAAKQQGVPLKEIVAVWHRGEVHLVGNHPDHSTEEGVERSIYHEVMGHHGMRQAMQNDLKPFLVKLGHDMGGVSGLLDYAKKHGIDLSDYKKGLESNPDMPRSERLSILAEELGAHIAQNGPPTWRQRIKEWFGAIKEWLRKHGFPGLSKLSDLDLAALLRKARKSITDGGSANEDATRFTRSDAGVPRHSDTMFSRKPADGDFDDLSDMPSRRPGESQQDYMRRVMRKNKDEVREALQVAKNQRAIGRLQMRAMWAKQDRQTAIADHVFNGYRKIFDKEDPRINLRTIDQWENGEKIWDPDARQFFDTMKDAFDQRIEAIQKLAPDAMQELIANYFPHIWEDSSKALKWYQGNMAKRPLEGNKAFLKQRTWGTIKEGMASGLKPVSTNPVDLAMLKLGQMDKFIAFNEFRQDLQQRGWLKRMEAGERTPPGYARVEDPAFQIAGGLQGYYAVPELIAKDINNYLSPSLYRFGAWKALRTVQNVLMSSRLGLSLFHGGFTTMDNLVMHADVAGRRMMLGDLAGGLQTLAKSPLSVVWSPIEGGHLNKQWLGLKPSDAHTAAILDMLEQGGAHMKMSPTDDNSGITKLIRAVRQKSVAGSAKQVLPAIGESISWVIHHKLVPNQKMAARVMLAKFELDRVAGALGKERGDYAGITQAMHPDALKQIAAHVVDLVDDRLGQMNYDNQFWNKTAREAAQAAIGAVGWQVGTLRTVTGGARDLQRLWNPEKLLSSLDKEGSVQGDMGRVTGRLSYLVTLALLMGGMSAVTQYLLTGKGPQEAEDYFFPKTGNKNDDGSDERLQWPSYWSDHYKLATHPIETAVHKINPSFGMLMEALSNRDYFGTEIRNPDDPWYKQAGEVGEYLAKGFIPYSLTGAEKVSGTTASPARQAANFVGITKAPASVSRTRFQEFVAEKAYDSMPQGARTQEQAEHAQAMHDVEAAMRRGESPDTSGLSAKDQRNAERAAQQQVPTIRFRRLSFEDKLRAYDLATPQEREEYGLAPIIFRSNWRQSIRELPEAEQQNVINKLESIDSDYRSAKP